MKKLLICMALISTSVVTFAQNDEEEKGGFKKENIFIGGGIGLGLGKLAKPLN